MGGKVAQETIEIAKKITETQAKVSSEVVLQRPTEGNRMAEGSGENSSEKFETIRAALSQESLLSIAKLLATYCPCACMRGILCLEQAEIITGQSSYSNTIASRGVQRFKN